jgi:hypothetical protein
VVSVSPMTGLPMVCAASNWIRINCRAHHLVRQNLESPTLRGFCFRALMDQGPTRFAARTSTAGNLDYRLRPGPIPRESRRP